jgi:glyoxylase-like metal-dependent hydrolase (beta-lactamase superfamily II)
MPWHSAGCGPLFSSFVTLSLAAGVPDGGGRAVASSAPLPKASPPPGMTVSRLPTGFIASRASRAFVGGRSDDVRRFTLSGLLVRHPRGDLLFDTGIGSQWATHRLALPWIMRQVTEVVPGVPAARQLAGHGYALSQLAGIVLTHAHWDHISGAQDFPGTPVWLNEAERAFVSSGHRSTRVARAIGPIAEQAYGFDGEPYMGFAASHDVWGDGSIVLVPAPGHTPGSVIVFIALPSGQRLALLGDIVWQMEGVELEVEKPWLSRLVADHAPDEVRDLVHVLAGLHAAYPALRMLPAHDEKAMSAIPVWPAVMA